MRALLAAATLLSAGAVLAQDAKPTADEIMEKVIQAHGGRAAMEKITSTHSKGAVTIDFAGGVTAPTEIFTKAPNKFLMVMSIEGFGQIRQGFDGTTGWADDPQGGLRDLKGEQLEQLKRQSVHNAALKWKELYPRAEVKGKEKVAGRDVWALVLTPASGKPVTQYYDVETFRLIAQNMVTITDQGEIEVKTEFGDYRTVNGILTPFEMKQTMSMGTMSFKFTEVNNNVEIEDAKFAKPVK